MQFAQSCKNIKNLLIFQKKCGIISTLQKIIGKSTHSLTDKIPDSGSGAGGSIPSGCIETNDRCILQEDKLRYD